MALGRHLSLRGLCVLLLGTVVGGQALELRLKDGAHRCEGRVEVKHQGEWGTVNDYDWGLEQAAVVCRQLRCGAAVEAPRGAYFGPAAGPIWFYYILCRGTESALTECQYSSIRDFSDDGFIHDWDAGAVCSGFVRLAGGARPCSGRVEVHSEQDWIPVSDRNFALPTAQVICAELGCGKAVSVLGHVPFRESDGQVWAEEFRCEGKEPELWSCPRVPCPEGPCHHSGAAQVVCSAYSEVRLMTNRTSQCEGQVEMNISGRWRALCASHWSLANANVVCHQLGCGVAISTPRGPHFMEGGDQISTVRFHCLGVESFLWECPVTALGVPDCSHGNTASAICSGNQTQVLPQCKYPVSEPAALASPEESAPYCSDSRQLRLVDGGGPCAGRVEILDQGSWGTICDDGWDLDDARVVCRQLGCGEALNATRSAHFGAGSGPIWLDDLNCTGNESHVWRCPSRGWGRHDCRHKQDAGVICSDFLALRMVSEDQQCAGWLEVFYNGTWGSVCRSPMEDITMSMICRQLGCGNSGSLNTSVALREGSRPRWVDGIRCQKTDTSLWQCPSDPWNYNSCSSKEEAYISCAGGKHQSCPTAAPCTDREKLRLRGGDSECSGRVEVWHSGSWGTVCDDSWSLAEAEVVCQQLGCGQALEAVRAAAFGPGNGSIWLDEVRCGGRESSLWDCAAEPWGQSDCKHEEDAGVRCSAPDPGILSLPMILCIILGALLFMVLIILGIQLHRWRAKHQEVSDFEDVVDEAVYQEIDDIIKPGKKDLLDSQGNLSDDSATKLPYYTGDNGEDGDPNSAPDPLRQHINTTGNGYDDADELPVPVNPFFPGMNENNFSPEDKGGTRYSQIKPLGQNINTIGNDYDDIDVDVIDPINPFFPGTNENNFFPDDRGGSRYSQTGISLKSLREAVDSGVEEKESSLVLRQEEPGYDDVDLSTM
ncbi:antigen WC1.1-like isoform X1 [Ovis canadensis]|uniref:antigen WC1.1-like isoform X1 n=1 Tax=Ovis canadensis TaxID=37174 RepID=UPI003750DD01